MPVPAIVLAILLFSAVPPELAAARDAGPAPVFVGARADRNDEVAPSTMLHGVDLDGDKALTLAESYLDGAGVPRDPIEAGILVWRVQHGAWSAYSGYWGMCMDCEGLWRHEKIVAQRIDRDLSPEEKIRVDLIARSRFPEIAARVRGGNAPGAFAAVASLIVMGGLVWRSRKLKSRALRPAETA